MKRWLLPVQFIVQGAFIALLAIGWGVNYFSWLGILLILIGLILALSSLNAGGGRLNDLVDTTNVNIVQEIADLFEKYPFPAFVTEKAGGLIAASEGLLRLLGKSRGEVFSAKQSELVPPNWQASKSESENKVWYALSEERDEERGNDESPPPPPPPPPQISSLPLLLDAETNAYSLAYAKMRTNDEIARIKRYKRWAVFLMVNFDFSPPGQVLLSEENKRKSFFRSYCAFLKSALRTCDAVCRASETALFAILPETLSGEPIFGVLKKISDFKTPLGDLVKALSGDIKMQTSHVFFNVSSPDMTFDDVMNNLYSSLSDYEC